MLPEGLKSVDLHLQALWTYKPVWGEKDSEIRFFLSLEVSAGDRSDCGRIQILLREELQPYRNQFKNERGAQSGSPVQVESSARCKVALS